jgi:hypothetical protein
MQFAWLAINIGIAPGMGDVWRSGFATDKSLIMSEHDMPVMNSG